MSAQREEKPSLAFGGQALLEGVMMRSPTHVVMCVRQPNNEISTHAEKRESITRRYKMLGLPFLRGVVGLFETFYLGIKGIYYSANTVLEEEEELTVKEFAVAIAFALALTSLFFIIPFLLTALLNLTGVIFNVVEAVVRVTIFLLYLVLVAMWGEFRRVLQYHGAEHKAINAHEAGVPLDVLNVNKFSRLHPRCGTSFIFIVILVSILLFSIMPNLGFAARLAYRVLLIPVIGAISYELLKLSDRYRDSAIMRILTIPGLGFQRLTTREPDDDMIEVALEAVRKINELSSS